MSVNRISQAHANEAHAVQNVNSQKSENAKTKAAAVDGENNSRVDGEPTTQTKPAATTDNNAGREQDRQQNPDNNTNGKRVNVFA